MEMSSSLKLSIFFDTANVIYYPCDRGMPNLNIAFLRNFIAATFVPIWLVEDKLLTWK